MGATLSYPLYNTATRDMIKCMEAILESVDRPPLFSGLEVAMEEDGVNLGAKTRSGWSMLHVACYIGHGNIVDVLCSDEAQLKQHAFSLNEYGASALMCIAQGHAHAPDTPDEERLISGGLSIIRIASKRHLQHADRKGVTALHCCAMHGLPQLVGALIERGVRLDAGASFWRPEDYPTDNAYCTPELRDDISRKQRLTPLQAVEARLKKATWLPANAKSRIGMVECIQLLKQATGAGEGRKR